MAKLDENRAILLASTVATSGLTIGKAGESLGWNKTEVYRVSRTAEYRQELARIVLDIADSIVSVSISSHVEAMEVITELLRHDKEEIRLNAAKAILANFSKLHESASRQLLSANESIVTARMLENNLSLSSSPQPRN